MKEEILKLISNGYDVHYRKIFVGPLNREIFHKLKYQVHWDKSDTYSELFDTPNEAVECFIEKVREYKREKI
jgi:hypothetical protein